MLGHSGYNLLDQTAARYGHSFAMLAFGVEGGGEDGPMDRQDAVVAMVSGSLFAGTLDAA